MRIIRLIFLLLIFDYTAFASNQIDSLIVKEDSLFLADIKNLDASKINIFVFSTIKVKESIDSISFLKDSCFLNIISQFNKVDNKNSNIVIYLIKYKKYLDFEKVEIHDCNFFFYSKNSFQLKNNMKVFNDSLSEIPYFVDSLKSNDLYGFKKKNDLCVYSEYVFLKNINWLSILEKIDTKYFLDLLSLNSFLGYEVIGEIVKKDYSELKLALQKSKFDFYSYSNPIQFVLFNDVLKKMDAIILPYKLKPYYNNIKEIIDELGRPSLIIKDIEKKKSSYFFFDKQIIVETDNKFSVKKIIFY